MTKIHYDLWVDMASVASHEVINELYLVTSDTNPNVKLAVGGQDAEEIVLHDQQEMTKKPMEIFESKLVGLVIYLLFSYEDII